MNLKYSEMSKEELINIIKNLKSNKRYGLVWDKEKSKEVFDKQLETHLPILKELEEKMIINDNTQPSNILIEGDNYHSLTALKATHKNKINIIYIDPPYNTGNKDFIYNDKIVDFDDGFRHSKWLNFMEKRLVLARDLLSEDGVIFISIDDNEFSHLKLLCNEVFGEENFIGNIIWKSKNGGANDSKYLICETEYILLYGKNKEKVILNKEELPLDEKKYKYEDQYVNERGRYTIKQLDNSGIRYSESLDFPIIAPDGREVYPGGSIEDKTFTWRWSKEKIKWGIENCFLEFKLNGVCQESCRIDFLKKSNSIALLFY